MMLLQSVTHQRRQKSEFSLQDSRTFWLLDYSRNSTNNHLSQRINNPHVDCCYNLSTTATSLQRPLSCVPKVSIVERSNCNYACSTTEQQKNSGSYNTRHKSWNTCVIFPSPMLIWDCNHLSAPKYAWLNIGEGEGHIWMSTKVWRVNVRNWEKIQDKWFLFQRFVTSIVGSWGS